MKIEVTDDVVVWHDFRRHNRPSVTYADLGPFRFTEATTRPARAKAATDVK